MATIKPRRGSSYPTTLSQNELAVDTINRVVYLGSPGGTGITVASHITNYVTSVNGVTGTPIIRGGSAISVTAGTDPNKGITITNEGVRKGISGSNITISPASGTGDVTIGVVNNPTFTGLVTAQNLAVTGDARFYANIQTQTLSVTGNAVIGGNLGVTGSGTFGSNLTVGGNFRVLGANTIIDSTNVRIKDPVVTIGVTNPPPVWQEADPQDRGINYWWHTGSAGNAIITQVVNYGEVKNNSTEAYAIVQGTTYSFSGPIQGYFGWNRWSKSFIALREAHNGGTGAGSSGEGAGPHTEQFSGLLSPAWFNEIYLGTGGVTNISGTTFDTRNEPRSIIKPPPVDGARRSLYTLPLGRGGTLAHANFGALPETPGYVLMYTGLIDVMGSPFANDGPKYEWSSIGFAMTSSLLGGPSGASPSAGDMLVYSGGTYSTWKSTATHLADNYAVFDSKDNNRFTITKPTSNKIQFEPIMGKIESGNLGLLDGATAFVYIRDNTVSSINGNTGAVQVVSSVNGATGAVVVPASAYTQVLISTNGGAQSGDTNLYATGTADTLTLSAGSGIVLIGNSAGDQLTIQNSNPTSFLSIAFTATGGSLVGIPLIQADIASDTLIVQPGTGIKIVVEDSVDRYSIFNEGVLSFNGSTGAVQGVSSVNGSTGAITDVAKTNTAQIFTGLQQFASGISAAGITVDPFGKLVVENFYSHKEYDAGGGLVDGGNLSFFVDGQVSYFAGQGTGTRTAPPIISFSNSNVDPDADINFNTSGGDINFNATENINLVSYNGGIVINPVSFVNIAGGLLYVDDTNNRVGINVGTSPQFPLDVSGIGNFRSGISAASSITFANGLQVGQTATFLGNIVAPNIVSSFNGSTGAVQGVSSVNGLTGAVKIGRSISVYAPTTTDNITMFYTSNDLTLSNIESVVRGAGTGVTFSVKYGTDRSASGTEVVTNGINCTNTTNGLSTTSFNNGTISASSFVWLTVSGVSGNPNELSVTLEF
jgi:hypothetical protein